VGKSTTASSLSLPPIASPVSSHTHSHTHSHASLCAPQLFPEHADQASPFKHDALSRKRFIFIAAAKDGGHAVGVTDNDWTFVWGEARCTGALGLGEKTKSTLPYLLKPLKKQKVMQVACSARHGLAVTAGRKVWGWGAKSHTHLESDVCQPQILDFLNNLGCTAVACSDTHSCAWNGQTCDVYSWGLPGCWLGFNDAVTESKAFGTVDFGQKVVS